MQHLMINAYQIFIGCSIKGIWEQGIAQKALSVYMMHRHHKMQLITCLSDRNISPVWLLT